MKKLAILGLCMAAGIAASAQMSLVKDVEHAIKGANPDYAAALNNIKPALTNDESKDQAQTWYVAGKAGFDYYAYLYGQKAIGQPVSGQQLSDAILSGYQYMMNVMPLDTIVDAKGKVKTKYSKDAVKALAGNYNEFYNVGVVCWEDKDYQGAYDAWGVACSMPSDPRLGKNAPKAPADTVFCDYFFNRGLAAWNLDNLPEALRLFEEAKAHGYNKKNLYDYAISVAAQSRNNEFVYKYSEEAYPLYGNEDPKYLQLIINSRIEKQQYDEAKSMLENAIAQNPDNAQYYNLMGILYEEQKMNKEALEYYRKSISLDDKYAHAQYNVGRQLCEEAYRLSDESSKLSQAEYLQLVENKINPLFKEAAEHLETAYQLDPDNMSDALRYLRNVYYNLHDEENYKRIEAM